MNSVINVLARAKCRTVIKARPVSQQALILLAVVTLAATFVHAQTDARRDSIEVQAARNKNVRDRGKKAFYNRTFDLNGVPQYQPEQKISGTIRIWGLNYLADANLADYWEAGFRKYHPEVKIEWHLPVAMASTSALVTGVGGTDR